MFKSTRSKSLNFITAADQVICTNEIGIIENSLTGDKSMELHNVAFAPECDINLISLGQLQESKITYHDHPKMMILIKKRRAIAYAKKSQNLFIF